MDNVFPLVSVVFTSYNHKEYLKQALDSLLNQTYHNIEIIIIDDCSTDGSHEILMDYAHYDKINLKIQTKNSGSYVKASNLGATFAKGEYLLFAQCDDFSEKDQIEKLVNAFKSNSDIGVAFSKSNLVDKNGVKLSEDFTFRERRFKQSAKNGLITGDKIGSFLSFSCVIPNLSAALIKRDLFESINGLSDSYLVVADWNLWLELSKRTNFYFINESLNNFRQHSTTIRSSIKMKTQIEEIFHMFYNFMDDSNLTNSERKVYKTGAGSIWFNYFLENKSLWIKNLWSNYILIKKYERFPFFYLGMGIKKHIIELVYRKIGK
jgi:glycosyltransferase involved in cell wall biosynthesis